MHEFMESHLQIFPGTSLEAESTVMPKLFNWVTTTLEEANNSTSWDDHCVVLVLNLPCVGVVSVNEWDFFLTLVSNLCNHWRRNGIAVIMAPNRAAQSKKSGRPLFFSPKSMFSFRKTTVQPKLQMTHNHNIFR